jgi:hypothetical protein
MSSMSAVEIVQSTLKKIASLEEEAANGKTSTPEMRAKYQRGMLGAAAILRQHPLTSAKDLALLTPEERTAYTAQVGSMSEPPPTAVGKTPLRPRTLNFDAPSLASDASAPDVTAAQPVAHAAAEPADDQEQPIVAVDQAPPTGPQVVEGPPLPPVVYTEPVTDSYVTEGLSRDGPSTGMPMTAQHAVEMDTEDGEGKSTDRLKDEIKAMHLVYNHKVKEFLSKAHQSAMHRALLSHDADTVRGHHRGMLEAIAKYYASGKGNGMRIGVVVSAEQYMAKFGGGGGGGAAAGGGGANPHHVQQVHSYRKGENPFSQAADVTSLSQRGGMRSYPKDAVAGHTRPPPPAPQPVQSRDPLARVDMPLQHAQRRPSTQLSFGNTYTLKSSKERRAVYD